MPSPAPSATSGEGDLAAVAAGLRAWLVDDALPFWATRGRDAKRKHFHESLFTDGAPDLEAPQRSRVQARQIYVFAHAHRLGWCADGAAIAIDAFDRLMQTSLKPGRQGGFHHVLSGRHEPLDTRSDSYDHAFMVLAFAWCWRATGEARVREALEETLAYVDAALTLPDGSLREDDRGTLPRRQNPHMHMFEAMLAVSETGARADGVMRADRLLGVVLAHFLDARSGLLGEFFEADLSPAQGPAGLVTEPGHMAEWVWLLRKRAAMVPLTLPGGEIDAMCAKLLANARASAEPHTGFLIDEADRQGRPLKTTRRMWPQTELAKALLAQAEADVPHAAGQAAQMLSRLFSGYIQPAPRGAWLDQFDAGGRLISDRLQASTFYHIFVAAAEADRVARFLKAGLGVNQP